MEIKNPVNRPAKEQIGRRFCIETRLTKNVNRLIVTLDA